MRFQLGQLVQTAGIAHESKNDPTFAHNVRAIFNRYTKCDWGDLCDDDKQANDNAVNSNDDRIVASYNVESKNGTKKVYVITEWDRSVTTILFAEEY